MNDFGLTVGRHFTVLPSLSDTQVSELQLDASGRLILSGRFIKDATAGGTDAGLLMFGQRRDADTTIATADGNYAPFQLDENGRLKVVADIEVANGFEKVEDSAHASADVGAYVLAVRASARPTNANTDADGDYASFFVNNNGELYTHDTDALAQLVLANASLDAIETDTAAIKTELLDQGTTLDAIDTSLNAIESSVASIDTEIQSLTHVEDTAHSSGHVGMMPLAVRRDADTSLVDTNGDYAPFQVDNLGRLKTRAAIDALGAEQYTVTDALAAAGDGLATITAAATPWVDVAVLSHETGIAYLYGWQWGCDANADARIVTDDGVDVIVYKRSVNSSAQPSYAEHWAEGGRIEIAGATNLEIKLQIKKRSAAGGNALGTGSLHIRTA